MDSSGWVAVGVVRGAFGVQGALKIEPYAAVESSVLNHVRRWRIERPPSKRGGTRRGRATGTGSQAAAVSPSGGGGGPVGEAARRIRHRHDHAAGYPGAGSRLEGCRDPRRSQGFPAPDPDEYYWADLIGCEVVDPAGRVLGTVVAVDDHGAQSVLRLDNRILIPFVAECVLEVAPAEKRIVADWSADWV